MLVLIKHNMKSKSPKQKCQDLRLKTGMSTAFNRESYLETLYRNKMGRKVYDNPI